MPVNLPTRRGSPQPASIQQKPCFACGRLRTSRAARCAPRSPVANRSAISRRLSNATSPNIVCTWIIQTLAADRSRRLTPLQLARLLRSAAAEKKAWDPVVLDVREQTSVADYFVICEGETDRQVRAIADGMMEAAKTRDRRPLAVDGYDDAGWILLDFDSVLAHVFLPGERSYYDLESLWAPAARRRRRAASA